MTENRMGTMPVNKLLLTLSVPMVISMMVQALYNIVDSIFVSWICEDALTAVSMAFSMQNLMISVGVGTGVGVNALLSKSLGEKEQERADVTAGNAITLGIINYLIFLVIGLTLSRKFFEWQTTDPQIIAYGEQYLRVVLIGSFALFVQIMFERLLISSGRTMYTMILQISGAVINVIFDPILIFGYLGFPKMGVTGAAVATVAGQIVACTLGLIFNLTKNRDIKLTFSNLKLDRKICARIYAVGIPSIVMSAIVSVTVFCLNKIVIEFTTTAVAVLGVYIKINSIVFMPVFGLNNGMVPIVAYNYGARNKERIKKTIRYTVYYAVGIMLLGLVLLQVMPAQLLRMFNASAEMVSIGVPALRTVSLSFVFAGFCIVCCSVFQALGAGVKSLIVSVTRQLVILVPAAYLLAKTGALNAVWWAYPIAEIGSLILCTFMLRSSMKKLDF